MQHSIFCYIIFALGQFFIRAHIYLEQCLFLSKWNLNNRSWNKACMVLIEKNMVTTIAQLVFMTRSLMYSFLKSIEVILVGSNAILRKLW